MTREPQPGEIENSIAEAIATVTGGKKRKISPSLHRARTPKWPPPAREKMEEIFRRLSQVTVANWEALSEKRKSQERILKWAFGPKEFICCGYQVRRKAPTPENPFAVKEFWKLDTWPRDNFILYGDGPQTPFIVPNPFKALRGLTKRGKPTDKSDSQVLVRRFLVIEFDFRSIEWTKDLSLADKLDHQARLHWHLACTYPLALLVFSGGESLHGWYATRWPIELMRDAAELGADTHLWTPSQFTRMPAGRHANGQRQRVVFFKASQLRH
jgi:hypothetical protein